MFYYLPEDRVSCVGAKTFYDIIKFKVHHDIITPAMVDRLRRGNYYIAKGTNHSHLHVKDLQHP